VLVTSRVFTMSKPRPPCDSRGRAGEQAGHFGSPLQVGLRADA
jgi:hypothetical protein